MTQASKKPYQDERAHERSNRDTSPLKSISVPTFDDKPALSLKDALAKAMREHTTETAPLTETFPKKDATPKVEASSQETSTKRQREDGDESYNKKIELKIRKEIDEEVLRKLLED